MTNDPFDSAGNPYQSPQVDCRAEKLRPCLHNKRTELADLLRQFIDHEITASEFNDRFWRLTGTSDRVVIFVSGELAQIYHKTQDRFETISESQWQHLRRLLLALESDAAIEIDTSYRRSWTQAAAAGAVIALIVWFPYMLMNTQPGPWRLLFPLPWGLLSIYLSQQRLNRSTESADGEMWESFEALVDPQPINARPSRLEKMQHHRELPEQELSRRSGSFPMRILTLLFLLVASPLAMLLLPLQILPIRERRMRLVMPPEIGSPSDNGNAATS